MDQQVQDTYSFRISHEELLFILSTLGWNTLPGLGQNPFDGLSAEQKDQMLVAGCNSLRAKGWAQLLPDEEHPLGLDRLFVLPLVVCASARNVMTITRQAPDQPSEKLLTFRSPDLFVMYRPAETGIYEFIVTANRRELSAVLMEVLISAETGNTLLSDLPEKFIISQDWVTKLINHQSNRDISEVRNLLEMQSVPDEAVENYISTLEHLQYTVTLSLLNFPEQAKSSTDFQARTLNILVSQGHLWVIEDKDKDALEFQAANGQFLQDIISRWVEE